MHTIMDTHTGTHTRSKNQSFLHEEVPFGILKITPFPVFEEMSDFRNEFLPHEMTTTDFWREKF